MNDKTELTLQHAQILYQTLADIVGARYNVDITATVRKKKGGE